MRRRLAFILAIVCTLVCGVSVWRMAARVGTFNEEHQRPRYHFQKITLRSFEYDGRPVEFIDYDDEQGEPMLEVRYGETVLRLRVQIPGPEQLPNMLPHDDWLRVLRLAESTGLAYDEFESRIHAGEITDRLVMVTRNLAPGTDEVSWGEVWRTKWTFDVYEFETDGTISKVHYRFPTTKRHEAPAEGELREGTWEWQAAMMLIPAGKGPKQKFLNDGLYAMGWTLPVAAFSMLGAMFGFAWAAFDARNEAIDPDGSFEPSR
ncbi:MAG: hypothetical protein KDA28_04710 [Phycisphaerales bacterium]|nr:hypothetical protein [Phycisphaerales bacterium]